ncbi:MAG: hypothetical protein QXI39_03245 [Candidatus Bathyarchaeia archaeon]
MSGYELAWLASFIGIKPEDLARPEELEKRLRLQKAVFLLKHLGIDPFTNYEFNLYIRGPYSPSLAREYYGISSGLDAKGLKPVPLNLGGKEDLLKWFVSKEEGWLEVASSILWIKERYPSISEKELFSILQLSKPWVNEEDFKGILKDLLSKSLL